MEKPPVFLKDFSKETAQNERDALAQSIREKRSQHFEEKSIEEEEKIKKVEKIKELSADIERLSGTAVGKVLNYFQLRKVKAELANIYEETDPHASSNEKIEMRVPSEFEDAKNMVERFYSEQVKQWQEADYTKEDIEKYFTEENLASLSIEEYAILLKRFPNQTVSHVTRQGVRDHFSMWEHSAGLGRYWNGFKNITDHGKLQNALSIEVIDQEKEKKIAEFLQLDLIDTKEEALKNLDEFAGDRLATAGKFADRKSIHFAAEEVADAFYGAESGNEIFFMFPAAFIASQYHFKGSLDGRRGDKYNDVWVYQKEQQGVNINAGIAFIPNSVQVDRKTGSRYEINDKGEASANEDYTKKITELVQNPDFLKLSDEVTPILGKMNGDSLSQAEKEAQKKVDGYKQRLASEFGLIDHKLQKAVMDYHFLVSLPRTIQENRLGEEVKQLLIDNRIYFKFTESDLISAKEYWENYFKEHPDKMPSKIVYYEGNDPTEALNEWKQKNGLRKEVKNPTDKTDMQFPENSTDFGLSSGKVPEEVAIESDRFKTLATKVIDDYYAKK